jgi:integrase
LQLADITWQHVHDAVRAEASGREDTIYRTMTLRGWSYLGACLRRAVSDFDLDTRICDRNRVKPPTKKQVDMATAKRRARSEDTDTREPWQRWDLDTAQTVLRHVKECHGAQWFAIVRLALGVGLRRSEICGLQWKNVDLDAGLVHVRGPRASLSETPNGLIEFNPPKSGAGTRTVPIGRDLVVALQEWAEEQAHLLGTTPAPRDGFVFTGDNGAHWRPKTLSDARWRSITRQLAPEVPAVTFHGLRKISGAFGLSYFGEDLYAVARRLGHSDIKVTQTHYAYLNLDRAEAFAAARTKGLALAS